MSIHAFWDNEEQTIIRFLYRRGNWEWHDFYAALEEARALVESVERKQVGFIIDITYGNLTPGIFLSQAKVLHEFRQHPSVSLVIVIGADRFIEALYQVSTNNVPLHELYYFARTLDDAHIILNEVNNLPRSMSDKPIPLGDWVTIPAARTG
jgi:hypothetical protein